MLRYILCIYLARCSQAPRAFHCVSVLASSSCFPSPFLTFRVYESYMQKIEGEGEPGTEPHPPVATWKPPGHGHVATHSIVHSTALTLPSRSCLHVLH